MEAKSYGHMPAYRGDARLLLKLQEKDRIIADLTHRIRTMSSVDISLRPETRERQRSVQSYNASHRKSKSVPSESVTIGFSLLKLFRRKRVSESKKEDLQISNDGVRRNSHFLLSTGSLCLNDTEDYKECSTANLNRAKTTVSTTIREFLNRTTEITESIDVILSSEECLSFTGYLIHELKSMDYYKVHEIKRRSLLLPHQLQSLKKLSLMKEK